MKENLKLNEYVLHLDFDYPIPEKWMQIWRREKTTMLEHMNLEVTDIIIKPSPSKRGGHHLWLHVLSEKELTDEEVNMLQWLLNDCPTRVWINQLRIERGLRKWWNKIFHHHLWNKPLPKNCQKCRLRYYINQMREEAKT